MDAKKYKEMHPPRNGTNGTNSTDHKDWKGPEGFKPPNKDDFKNAKKDDSSKPGNMTSQHGKK